MAPSGDSRDSFVHRALPIYLGLLFAILTVVAIVVLFMVRHVLLVLFVSVLFAAALTGPSEWLHRRFRLPLGLAAVVIYIACFAVIVGIGWIVVPPLLGQVVEFADRAPSTPIATGESVRRTRGFGPTFLRSRRSRNSCLDSEMRSSTVQATGLPRFRATSFRSSSTCLRCFSSRCSSSPIGYESVTSSCR